MWMFWGCSRTKEPAQHLVEPVGCHNTCCSASEFEEWLRCRLSAIFTPPLSSHLVKPKRNGWGWRREIFHGDWCQRRHLWLVKTQTNRCCDWHCTLAMGQTLTVSDWDKSISMDTLTCPSQPFITVTVTHINRPLNSYTHLIRPNIHINPWRHTNSCYPPTHTKILLCKLQIHFCLGVKWIYWGHFK